MKKLIFLILIVHCTLFIDNCMCQWVLSSNGIGNTYYIYALTVSGNNIFSGTGNGVYLSTNNGQNWIQTTLNYGNVYSLAINGINIFAGSYNPAVYFCSNNGINWSQTNLYQYGFSLAVNGSYVFVGTSGSGVYRTANNGTNWTQTSLNNRSVFTLAANGNSLFAGTESFGVYISTNNGTNWTQTQTELNNKTVRAITFSGNNIFAGTISSGIYISTNNGSNWTQTSLDSQYVNSLCISGINIFAGTQGGVYLSTNNGENWIQINQGFSVIPAVTALSIANNYIIAGTSNQSIWRFDIEHQSAPPQLISPANNTSEHPININLVWSKPQYSYFYNIVVATDASFNNIIVDSVLTDTGLYVSNLNTFTNYYWKVRAKVILNWSAFSNFYTFRTGSPWISLNGYMGSVKSFTTNGNNIFAGTVSNGVYKSTNNGTNWTAINNGLTNHSILSLTYNNNNLYAGTNGSGVFQSTNNGEYWIAVSNGLGSNEVKSLLSKGISVFAGTPWGIYVTTNNGGVWTTSGLSYMDIRTLYLNGSDIFAGTYGNGVYLSTNNGANWESRNSGLGNMNVYSIVINGSNLYAGTQAGVYLSTNYGLNWTAGWLTNQSIYSLAANNNRIFVGSNNGSLVSFDNGLSWININFGFVSVSYVYSYLIYGNYIFAGTDNSVWRRILSEIIGIKNISVEIPSTFSLLQNYPNPFNPNTKIKFQIKDSRFVTLRIYDILGKEVATLVNENLKPGIYETCFDGSNLSSGIYFYKLIAGEYTETKKMNLIK